jgi:hydroxyacylglutathione hydrolase
VLQISLIPVLTDNYIFIGNYNSGAFIIDPASSAEVIDFLDSHKLSPKFILITHHHRDHTNGIAKIKNYYKNLEVIVPTKEYNLIKNYDKKAERNFTINEFKIEVIDLPGHTLGHVGFHFINEKILFCGDTLFSAGCGRIFEGTAEQMFNSIQKIKHLSNETLIYCTHEYTLNNLNFATTIEPDNLYILDEINKVKKLREQNIPTIPTTVKKEKLINPFLRTDTYLNKFPGMNELEIFTKIRAIKDRFT